MNYDETVKALQTMLEIPLNQTDENFMRILPRIFEYAEGRIYREMNFLLTTGKRIVAFTGTDNPLTQLPQSVVVVRQVNLLTPPALADSTTLKRNTLERVSPEMLDMFWPEGSKKTGLPKKYAVLGSFVFGNPDYPLQILGQEIRWAPLPDAGYMVEVLGTFRPNPLSAANPETFLSKLYPDLLLAACMVFACGYQRDFGSMAEDPAKAMSWEGTYTTLKQGVMLEAARQSGEGSGWTSLPPAPVAGQPRAP